MLLPFSVYWFILTHTRAPQKMGRGGQEVVCCVGLWGFSFFLGVLTALCMCLSCSLCCAQRLQVCNAARSQRHFPEETGTQANPPQYILCGAKPSISLHACRKVCGNTLAVWNVEGDESGLQPNWPYKLLCMRSVLALWSIWVFLLKIKENQEMQRHTDELQPVWRWIAPASKGWELQEPANNSSYPGGYLLVWIIILLWLQTCYDIQLFFSFALTNMVSKWGLKSGDAS